MATSSRNSTTGKAPDLAAGILMRFAAIVATLAVQALLLFGGAGTLRWPWAWIYFAISLAVFLINGALMLRLSPETIAERGRPREMRGWDKVVTGVGGVAMYLALPLVAGFDVRFGWTPALSVAWHVAGAAVLAAGYGLTAWAMDSNAYFSTVVRHPKRARSRPVPQRPVPVRAPSGLRGLHAPGAGDAVPAGILVGTAACARDGHCDGDPYEARGSHAAGRAARLPRVYPGSALPARAGDLVGRETWRTKARCRPLLVLAISPVRS